MGRKTYCLILGLYKSEILLHSCKLSIVINKNVHFLFDIKEDGHFFYQERVYYVKM